LLGNVGRLRSSSGVELVEYVFHVVLRRAVLRQQSYALLGALLALPINQVAEDLLPAVQQVADASSSTKNDLALESMSFNSCRGSDSSARSSVLV
jgi:hypothetical protein